jgi:hypothetical protein
LGASDDSEHGQHRGWTNFPPSTVETDTQGPSAAASTNHEGTN